MKVEPQKQHEWLQQLVGEWSYAAEAEMGPDQPPYKDEGIETVHSLGGLWIVGEGEGTMPDGTPAKSRLTLGYDPESERFIGSWIGSMMTHMWVYEGTLDADEKVLTLDTTGPDMSGNGSKTIRYQDIVEIVDEDHRTLTSRALGEDGEWHEFMQAVYKRKA